jgi:hypothetical protein
MAQVLNCKMDLPKGHVLIENKDPTEDASKGNILATNAEEKRSKEDFLTVLDD